MSYEVEVWILGICACQEFGLPRDYDERDENIDRNDFRDPKPHQINFGMLTSLNLEARNSKLCGF